MSTEAANLRVKALSKLRAHLPSKDPQELSDYRSEIARLAALAVVDHNGLNVASIDSTEGHFSITLKNGNVISGEIQNQNDLVGPSSFNDARFLVFLGKQLEFSTADGSDLNLSQIALAQMVLDEKVSAIYHWPRPMRIEFLEDLASSTSLPRSLGSGLIANR